MANILSRFLKAQGRIERMLRDVNEWVHAATISCLDLAIFTLVGINSVKSHPRWRYHCNVNAFCFIIVQWSVL